MSSPRSGWGIDGDEGKKQAYLILKGADSNEERCEVMAKNDNSSLGRAKKQKKDEFYTRLEDIECELAHYKEIFSLIMADKMWLGYGFSRGNAYFKMPNGDTFDYAEGVYDKTTGLVKFRNCTWFTNLDIPKRHNDEVYWQHYTPEQYPKLDNFDAIEVERSKDIPCDYDGTMAVPVTFLDKYTPDQFEIVGIAKTWFGGATKIYPNQIQVGTDGKRSIVSKLNDGAVLRLEAPPKGKTYYLVDDIPYIQLYPRILIRRRK